MSSVRREAPIVSELEHLVTNVPQCVDKIALHVTVSRSYVRQVLNKMARWGMINRRPQYLVKNRWTGKMRVVAEIDRASGDCLEHHRPTLYWKESK